MQQPRASVAYTQKRTSVPYLYVKYMKNGPAVPAQESGEDAFKAPDLCAAALKIAREIWYVVNWVAHKSMDGCIAVMSVNSFCP